MNGRPKVSVPLLTVAVSLVSIGLASPLRGDEPPPAKYLFPAKDVDGGILKSDASVVVGQTAEFWSFAPAREWYHGSAVFPGWGCRPDGLHTSLSCRCGRGMGRLSRKAAGSTHQP